MDYTFDYLGRKDPISLWQLCSPLKPLKEEGTNWFSVKLQAPDLLPLYAPSINYDSKIIVAFRGIPCLSQVVGTVFSLLDAHN